VFLHRVLEDYRGDDVTVLPPQTFFPFPSKALELQTLQASTEEAHALRASLIEAGTYAVHYWANSWVDLAGELVNPDPHHVAGYDFYPGLDSPGNDLANVGRDVVRAAQACTRMAGAVAFNTDGFVKSRLLPRDQWLPSRGDPAISGLYVRRRDGPLASLRRLSSGIFGRR